MLSCGRRFHAIVQRLTTVAHKLVVDVARIAVHPRRDLRRQQRRDGAVFVRQDAAISMDERTRALNHLPIRHGAKIADIRVEVIVPMRRGGIQGTLERNSLSGRARRR